MQEHPFQFIRPLKRREHIIAHEARYFPIPVLDHELLKEIIEKKL